MVPDRAITPPEPTLEQEREYDWYHRNLDQLRQLEARISHMRIELPDLVYEAQDLRAEFRRRGYDI